MFSEQSFKFVLRWLSDLFSLSVCGGKFRTMLNTSVSEYSLEHIKKIHLINSFNELTISKQVVLDQSMGAAMAVKGTRV